MDKKDKSPWEGTHVQHKCGTIGLVLCPAQWMPGYFLVEFADGVKSKQPAEALSVNGRQLDQLMREFDQDFSSTAVWKELCSNQEEFFRKRFEGWKLAVDERTKAEIVALISSGQFEKAEDLYSAAPMKYWPRNQFLALMAKQKGHIGKKLDLQQQIAKALAAGHLWEADNLYFLLDKLSNWPAESYVSLKRDAIAAYLAWLTIDLDEEQIHALLRPEARLLISARAGSGKTRTLAAKASLVIQDEGLEPDQVLILAFNKSAALELKYRVRSMGSLPAYENARTFHSLAHQLVKPKGKLLFDSGGHPSSKKQSLFIQSLIQKILTPAFKQALYDHFRKELEHVEEIGRGLPEDEYFLFRRSLEYISLSGEKVKSNGEKAIADFLFEHGIGFEYEKVYDWKKKGGDGSPYAPDFSIVSGGNDFILEHWALDLNNPNSFIPDDWDTDTEAYRCQIANKRQYWLSEGIPLLETHAGMLRQGRMQFESELYAILTSAGILCKKLPNDELIRRVIDNDFVISHLAQMFLQFIQRAKKRGWSPDRVAEELRIKPDPEARSRIFHDLALRTYREYEHALVAQGGMDFDDLLIQAASEVTCRGQSCTLHLGLGHNISLGELRWILVDEFQDFSELYYRLLSAILAVNPMIKLVSVGDDWQAINGFAGAETRFFRYFSQYFDGVTVGITTNYRSGNEIVALGNSLMSGQGAPAKSSKHEAGQILVRSISDIWIEFRSDVSYAKARLDDSLYLGPLNSAKGPGKAMQRRAKALKACVDFFMESPDQGLLLIARTNNVYGVKLDVFRGQLDRILTERCKEKGISRRGVTKAMTAHSSKGQESPCVIVLDATQKQFPKIHPDNLLFMPFGVTPDKVIEEERRLFYVAATRAESRLLILTEKGAESPFLTEVLKPSKRPVELSSDPCVLPIHPFILKIRGLIKGDGGFRPSHIEPKDLAEKTLDWDAIRNDVDPELFELVDLLKLANVSIPAVSYELPDDEVEAALAWPWASIPIAVLTAPQQEFIAVWKARGFRVPPLDLSVLETSRRIKKYVG